jgi:hypothetical protein
VPAGAFVVSVPARGFDGGVGATERVTKRKYRVPTIPITRRAL